MLRLFVAVDLPVSEQQAVARLCANVHGARWSKPHQLHITLRFMGGTPEEELPAIRERLARVPLSPFELELRGVGVFPAAARRPRVLWLGVTPREPLCRLERDIDRVLAVAGPAQGSAREPAREFSPHLTLARLSGKPDETLTRFLARHADYRGASHRVDSFRLYKSTLHPSGAVHEVLATYPLGPNCRES
ncbi:MAG: RNA 2',3'-cyclic phosphodiesterase [Deltaproteobacteria bacterium]|jgi:2'-5' RNA ligase|nr:RNA 2',3'-cyclic phosphodiesterase [Deltaproteobacteria bacterium]